MNDMLEIVEARRRSMIPSRLVKGAAILGRLWRENVRCLSQWSGICPCASPTDFCLAKRKWLELVRELHDGYPHGLSGNEGFLVLECMDGAAFEASGLTIVKELPRARSPIRIGRGGTCPQTILDLAEIYEKDPANYASAVETVVRIQEVL